MPILTSQTDTVLKKINFQMSKQPPDRQKNFQNM